MIAALPMYDRPETAAANDRLWAAIRAQLGHGPEALDRHGDLWAIWRAPDLLLAQTCGLPYRARLRDRVTLVAAPDHGLPNTPPGQYHSVIVIRAEDPARDIADLDGRTLAYNDPLSQSGWAAPSAHAATHGIAFGSVVETGAHRASARAVAEGQADCAALDAVSWALMERHDAFAARLRVIDHTAPTPALPFITAQGNNPAPIARALGAAIAALDPSDRDRLCLHGIVPADKAAYLAQPIPAPPRAA